VIQHLVTRLKALVPSRSGGQTFPYKTRSNQGDACDVLIAHSVCTNVLADSNPEAGAVERAAAVSAAPRLSSPNESGPAGQASEHHWLHPPILPTGSLYRATAGRFVGKPTFGQETFPAIHSTTPSRN
jgi:hypothetical protein